MSSAQNVAVWTHLGLLYLHHNDLQLANEALLRAQTLDPDYTLAWVGQALVAAANKHDTDAKNLLEHAVSLPSDVVSMLFPISTTPLNMF
jgi:superkiller protein 3